MGENTMRTWGVYTFYWVCAICPETNETGKIREFMPQDNYENRKGLSLNPYGHGPFCKFRIPSNTRYAGVYILTLDGHEVYVGECLQLSARYNSGYGNISPRNCYEGGQRTNCRINNLVYNVARAGKQIELWFLKTPDRKIIEAELIDALHPKWNL